MSTANRRRRAMRRNPKRFMLDNIFSDGPFLQELRRRELKRRGPIASYGKKKREIMMGIDVGNPGGDYTVEMIGYVDHEGGHIVR